MARILVVDDDQAIRSSLARFLGRLDHEVVQAGDGREALRVMEKASPDLVITDINMPEMDGIEIIATLLEIGDDVPVIAMSGGGLVDKELLLDNAGALGAVSTIEKPFGLEELERLVVEALGS